MSPKLVTRGLRGKRAGLHLNSMVREAEGVEKTRVFRKIN